MNTTQIRILELFESLDDTERREVADQLRERSLRGSFHDQMTESQRLELATALAEADRGEGTAEADVFDRIGRKLGLALT